MPGLSVDGRADHYVRHRMAHGHEHAFEVPARTRRMLRAAAIGLAVVTAIGVFLLRPGDPDERPDIARLGATSTFYDATVADVEPDACVGIGGTDVYCERVSFELKSGPDKGTTIGLDFPASASTPSFAIGDDVVLSYAVEAEPGFQYQFADRQRKPTLLWLAALFALAVVVLGRLRGIAALVGLAASVVVLLGFVLPAIIDGRSPIWVAVTGAAVISFLALYMAHGLGPMTTVALLGTLCSLALTAVLAVVFMAIADFTGFASEEAVFLQAAGGAIDLNGLTLAGVVIGALGALDDMTVTQASAVWELRAADPGMPRGTLTRAGLRIGRDHVASTVNTLALAYAGASMPVLLLLVLSQQPIGTVISGEVLATEIIRTLVGSIGLVAAVPVTTWLAAAVAPGAAGPRPESPPGAHEPHRDRGIGLFDEDE